MVHESPDSADLVPVAQPVCTALPPARASAACPPASCDASRAAAGRAGSFNSGKNESFFNRHQPTCDPSGCQLKLATKAKCLVFYCT